MYLHLSEVQRAYFYRIASAVLAALVVYGLVDAGDLPVFLDVVAAVLGIASAGLAAANTSRKA